VARLYVFENARWRRRGTAIEPQDLQTFRERMGRKPQVESQGKEVLPRPDWIEIGVRRDQGSVPLTGGNSVLQRGHGLVRRGAAVGDGRVSVPTFARVPDRRDW
jgi:hypothetical protein